MTTSNDFPVVNLAEVRIHRVNRAEVFSQILEAVEHGHGGNINNVNVHAMNTTWQDPEFRHIVNNADLVFVDGFGVQLGARLAGLSLGERLTPADWIDDLLSICSERGWPIFWLGDTEEVGEEFEQRLRQKHPELIFAGRHHGFFAKDGAENQAVVDLINASGARILLVGMSMPIQEKWIWANRDRLQPPVRLALGGLARIVTGHIRRGPPWLTQNGLEWLYRLAVQPSYTWRRYLIGNPFFLLRILGWRLFRLKPKAFSKES